MSDFTNEEMNSVHDFGQANNEQYSEESVATLQNSK